MVVANGFHAYKMENRGRSMSFQEYRSIKDEQRTKINFWKSEWAFPTGDVTERSSLLRAREFICCGMLGCTTGDCLFLLETHDVKEARERARARVALTTGEGGRGSTTEGKMLNLLHFDAFPLWDGERFGPMHLRLSPLLSVDICVAAYAFLIGVKGSSAQTAFQRIKEGTPPPVTFPVGGAAGTSFGLETKAQTFSRKSVDASRLEQYVHEELLQKNEQNPAPGASRAKETNLTKRSWEEKWKGCCDFFRNTVGHVVGSKKLLKKAWKNEELLKEKTALSHSKCTTCKTIEVEGAKLVGINQPWADERREHLSRVLQEHEAQHLGMREVVDQHSWLALTKPSCVWTIMCDAMTQRTTQLPRYSSKGFRPSKAAAGTLPKWGFKLTATYSFGYGFLPFLTHDSLEHGPDLVWTIIWLTICALYKHHGFYADVLFLVLDNTTGENKTAVMLAMAAWLVATGRFKQVRVFFLLVGHTHIIIDQIFGVITKRLKGHEILTPERLISIIDRAMSSVPQYDARPVQWLRSIFDFWGWHHEMKVPKDVAEGLYKRQTNLHDAQGKYCGMQDFIFTSSKEHLALMQYREMAQYPLRPEGSPGIPIIFELPSAPPKLKEVTAYSKWGKSGSNTIEKTIEVYLNMSACLRTVGQVEEVREIWRKHISEVPTIISMLDPKYKLKFEHFEYDPRSAVPRLTMGGGGAGEPEHAQEHAATEQELDRESRYQNFLAEVIGIRTKPFAYDPVTHEQQPRSAFQKNRAKAEDLLLAAWGCNEPTSLRSSLCLGGRLLFVSLAEGGVTLAKIEGIGALKTPRSPDVLLDCTLLTHTPQEGVSGFFGTFKTASAGARKKQFTRDNVLVYNVDLDKNKKTVSLRSLRVLATVLPERYPVPDRVPRSHLDIRGTGRARRNKTGHKEGTDSESGGESETNPEEGRAASKRKPPEKKVGARRKKKQKSGLRTTGDAPTSERELRKRARPASYAGADEDGGVDDDVDEDGDDDDDDDDDKDYDSSDDGDEEEVVYDDDGDGIFIWDEVDVDDKKEEEERVEEQKDDDESEKKKESAKKKAGESEVGEAGPAPAGTTFPTLMPPCPDFLPQPPEILFFNMKGDEEADDQAYPVCPVYVHRLVPETGKFEIYWYQWGWRTRYPPGLGPGTKHGRTTVVYDKFMKDPEWRKTLNLAAREVPDCERLLPCWGANGDDVPATFFVPLRVCSGTAYKETNLMATARLTFNRDWWENILIPKLVELNITNVELTKMKKK